MCCRTPIVEDCRAFARFDGGIRTLEEEELAVATAAIDWTLRSVMEILLSKW